MKTIFKRAAAWFLTALMILNCVPVYAQDTSTDYSGQQISLADYVATAAVENTDGRTTLSNGTWTVPVYFYPVGSTEITKVATRTLTYNIYGSGTKITFDSAFSTELQDLGIYASAKYATGIEQAGEATRSIQARRSSSWSGYTYSLRLDDSNSKSLSSDEAKSYAIYVAYTPNNVTATFNPNLDGAEKPDDKTVTPGGQIQFPDAPERENGKHYEFGWVAEGETEVHKPGDKLTLNENKEFTGKWTPIQYTAKFNLNYDDAPPIPDRIRTIEDEAPATFPTATREGYTLLGWNTAASAASEPAVAAYDLASDEGGVTAYADGAEYEVGEEIPLATATYDAVWAADSYTVTFDFNGGYSSETHAEQTTITVGYGESFDLPKGYREGEYAVYELIGWEDEAGQLYDMDMEADATPYSGTITSDMTFTAVWQATCTITLDCAGGAFEGQPDVLSIDVLIPMGEKFLDWIDSTHEPLPPEGYIFAGWLDGSTMITADSEVTQDTTLIAQYTKKNGYFVDFLLDGESIYKVLVPFDTDLLAYINANADVKTSHMISGSEVKLGAFDWKHSDGTPITSGHIVTEDIEVIGTLGNVTVTFYNDSTKDEQVGDVQTLPYGRTVSSFPTDELTAPDGMSFVEWRYSATEGEVRFDSNTPVYQDMKVYAHYAQMHTLTFYTDSTMTTVADTVQVPHGELFDTSLYPSVAVPEGQTLRYWVYNAGDSHQVFNPLLPVTSDMSLYPVFDNYVFVLKDAETGKTLTSIYNGDPVDFTVEAPEGYYYTGIKLADGTFIETDGEENASTDLFKVTTAVNGQYTVNVTPVFEEQLTVVYHAGEGATILAAGGADTYTLTVDASVQMPGALDIVRTDSSSAVALSGWAVTADATTVLYEASDVVTNEQLKKLADENGEIHLYPVWSPAENAVAVTFESNYPEDAVDANGNKLEDVSYTIYIKSGAKPVMPTLAQAGMPMPNYDNGDGTIDTGRYGLSGWSLMPSGEGDNDGTTNGVYTAESQYQVAITGNTTFYAAWIDYKLETNADYVTHFFIRSDGTIPQEPGGYTPNAYYPGTAPITQHDYLRVTNALRKYINIVNDPAKVSANIQAQPEVDKILEVLPDSLKQTYATRAGETLTSGNYGTVWTVQWYACKLANWHTSSNTTDVTTGDYLYDPSTKYHFWHVDGRIRILKEYELTYWPNGGTSQYIPPSETHSAGASVTITYLTNSNYPYREGYTFVGWSENKNTTWQEVQAATDGDTEDGIWKKDSSEKLTMEASDVDLYAIWKPNTLELSFNGVKYMMENNTEKTATQSFSFLVEKQNADGTYTTVKTLTNSLDDGSFSFKYEFDSSGLHTFRVTEIKGTDANIAYDGAVYTITVYIGDGDQGLYEVGRTVMKNNVIQSDKTVKFVNRVGQRDVTVTKVWNDNNNQDGIRPSYIVVGLTRDELPYGSSETLTAANGWSATWKNLPIASDGAQHVYDVVETSAGVGYTSEKTGNMDAGFTITNTHTPLTTEITVTKQWVDDSNAAKMRPEKIVLTLTGSDGSTRTATLTGTENSWTYTFTGLPVYYGVGNLVTYTLDETDVPNGYTKSVDGYTVTNTLQSGYSFTVNKNVAGNFASRTKEFNFTANILAADGKTVIRTETFTLVHGGSKVITGIPYGAYVQVTEDPDGYVAQHLLGQTLAEGESYKTTTPIINSDQGVTFLNTKTAQIDTGVDLDTIPYVVMLLSIFGAGALWLIGRRRRTQN